MQNHLLKATPHDLAKALAELVASFLNEEFASLLPQVPELLAHLQQHIYPRTMLHFAELLKHPTENRAWRAFQRLLLETLHGPHPRFVSPATLSENV